MIWAIGTFVFDSKLGRIAAAALGVVVLFSAWLWRHDTAVAHRATTAIVERAKDEGKKAHAKATKAHDAARAPGAADRLLKSVCRDCDR